MPLARRTERLPNVTDPGAARPAPSVATTAGITPASILALMSGPTGGTTTWQTSDDKARGGRSGPPPHALCGCWLTAVSGRNATPPRDVVATRASSRGQERNGQRLPSMSSAVDHRRQGGEPLGPRVGRPLRQVRPNHCRAATEQGRGVGHPSSSVSINFALLCLTWESAQPRGCCRLRRGSTW